MSTARSGDRLFALLQRCLPTRLLSSCMYGLTRVRWKPFKNLFIRVFMQGFGIRLDEAIETKPEAFVDFNAFFTRALQPSARPLAPAPALLSPVDGTLSQFGPLQAGRLLQAKGHDYDAASLLADATDAARFTGGDFATIYLAPYNYHRIHMPLSGRLSGWRYIPGRLFSVNASTARAMPRLFARNERLVAFFDGDQGAFAMVLVGALFVGGLETVWTGAVTPPHRRGAPGTLQHPTTPLTLQRGDEMGRFNMGSTVILLTTPGLVQWSRSLQGAQTLRMGESLGQAR